MNMNEIFKMVYNADAYPNQAVKAMSLQKGDEFFITHTNEALVPGQKYKSYDGLVVKQVVLKPKPWWQFWKRREVLGYVIMCVKG